MKNLISTTTIVASMLAALTLLPVASAEEGPELQATTVLCVYSKVNLGVGLQGEGFCNFRDCTGVNVLIGMHSDCQSGCRGVTIIDPTSEDNCRPRD